MSGEPTLLDAIADGVEPPISVPAACRLPVFRIDGRPLAVASAYRFARRGVAGVRLETVALAGRTCTTAQAVHRFVRAVAEAREHGRRTPDATAATPRQATAAARRQHEQAVRQLAAAGLGVAR